MRTSPLEIVILGLSITSSWGNGHATTYRALIKELYSRGHDILFLERDLPWYAENRDMPHPRFCKTGIYSSIEELKDRFSNAVRKADLVIVGSYVPDGIEIGEWVTMISRKNAFYDIDTPVTLSKLLNNECEYLTPGLISNYDLYLSFTGGPTLEFLEETYGSPMARPLYCSVDTSIYYPEEKDKIYDLGYLGTYSEDRQPTLENLFIKPAIQWPEGKFIAAGPQYPESVKWPSNVERIIHLNPAEHRNFYNSQKMTLNITRAEMIKAGYSPSVRLFEAAACAIPIISDYWKGMEAFFKPGKEILISNTPEETIFLLDEFPEEEKVKIGRRAYKKILKYHTAAQRAEELENYFVQMFNLVNRKSKVV